MEKINLHDYFKIDDSHSNIRGFVVMTRKEDGKVLFSKENLIVKNGRKLIQRAIFGSENVLSLENFKFFIGNNNSLPIAEETAISENYKIIGLVSESDDPTEINITPNTDDDEELFTQVNLKITAGLEDNGEDGNDAVIEEGTYTTAGLIYDDDGTEILFSRVSFPSISLRNGQEYELNYYIYF